MKVLISFISVSILTVIIYSCSPSSQFTNLYVDDAFKGMQIKKALGCWNGKRRMEKKSI